MDRVYLDASVLYATAARPGCAIERLWNLGGVRLLTSSQAAEEATRNLDTPDQRERLKLLLQAIDVRPEPAPGAMRMVARELYQTDAPALVAAVAAKATHILTADVRKLGEWLGKSVAGVLVMKPASYLC